MKKISQYLFVKNIKKKICYNEFTTKQKKEFFYYVSTKSYLKLYV